MYRKTIACLLSCILAGLLVVTPVSAGEGDVVAVFKLKGPLPEQPDSSGIAALLGDKAPANMFNLLKKLRHARSDDNLKAVIFEIDQAALGMGQIQEVRAQFEALRAADKDVWVFSEHLGNGTLMLGSAASRLVLVPSGEVDFTGLYGEALYFKNTLDKVGLEADILHCGDFKSAGEPFYRTGPSKEAEAQNNRLLDSIFDQMLAAIAKSRRLSDERVRELVDIGVFSSKEALEAKLVDKLQYREDFVKSIKKRYGEDTKIVSNYGGEKGLELDLDNPFGIFKFFGDMMKGKDKSSSRPFSPTSASANSSISASSAPRRPSRPNWWTSSNTAKTSSRALRSDTARTPKSSPTTAVRRVSNSIWTIPSAFSSSSAT